MSGELPWYPAMLAIPGQMAPEPEQALWAYEMKWDGVRALAYVESATLRLYARSGREITSSYPELWPLGEALRDHRAVLDGEIVAFDDTGKVSFAALQPRIHGGVKGSLRPVAYLVFDVLYLDGRPLLDEPYVRRRELLESLDLKGPNWQTAPSFGGAGDAALRASQAQGLEGVVAKRLDSKYEPGVRSRAWTKIKNIRTQDVVIGGWRTGKDSRATTFGSLLCGVYDEQGRLAYVGRVGSGFDAESLRFLHETMRGLSRETSPFDSPSSPVPDVDRKDAHWIEPTLVGDVVFAAWTPDGRLWHPRWRGLRGDKDPRDVTRES